MCVGGKIQKCKFLSENPYILWQTFFPCADATKYLRLRLSCNILTHKCDDSVAGFVYTCKIVILYTRMFTCATTL